MGAVVGPTIDEWKGMESKDSGRAAVLRGSVIVGASTGLYGIAFGALASSAGLSVLQASVVSALALTGGSQFVAIGVLSGGGSAAAALGAAWMLGARNAFYGLRTAPLVGRGLAKRMLAAQLTIDESTAMASAQPTRPAATLGFWSTGLAVFLLWTAGTALGASGAASLSSPSQFGLDAASPAAFVAFLAPQLKTTPARRVFALSALVCLALVAVTQPGIPILAAAAPALGFVIWDRKRRRKVAPDAPAQRHEEKVNG